MLQAPSESERLAMLEVILGDDIISPDVSVKHIAVQTAALVANDLVDLAARARLMATQRMTERR